ncbi:ArsR/SmtB family transcription factor [Corynebacterium aquatimens]|uniref:DNA-binding transcriptional ArsR family regulator n=1 Tax=Corynebacterium aquatimens TaxID=1190508 RepID=A0A931DXS7_9CORY|nr:helix-turn-helix domain-containing protein [Corynebacterium aquatimens]MBG6122075.1 DNA-binding transcriptional ArsR family regulator [Corynebacterium aquatimens]
MISALDSPLRLRILILLDEGPHVVHQLVTKLDKSQPLISQHLRVLKKAGLVEAERSGREVVYSLTADDIVAVLEAIQEIGSTKKAPNNTSRRKTPTAVVKPDLLGVSERYGSVAAAGPPAEILPEVDPGLLPSQKKPLQ